MGQITNMNTLYFVKIGHAAHFLCLVLKFPDHRTNAAAIELPFLGHFT